MLTAVTAQFVGIMNTKKQNPTTCRQIQKTKQYEKHKTKTKTAVQQSTQFGEVLNKYYS